MSDQTERRDRYAARLTQHRVECVMVAEHSFGWQCLTCKAEGWAWSSLEAAEQASLGHHADSVMALADAELVPVLARAEAAEAEVERLRADVERYRPLWSDPLSRPERWRDEPNPHPRPYISTHEVLEDYDGAIRCSSNWSTDQRHAALDRTMGHVRPLVYEVEHLRANRDELKARAEAAEAALVSLRGRVEGDARALAATILRDVLAERSERGYLIDALTRSALRRHADALAAEPTPPGEAPDLTADCSPEGINCAAHGNSPWIYNDEGIGTHCVAVEDAPTPPGGAIDLNEANDSPGWRDYRNWIAAGRPKDWKPGTAPTPPAAPQAEGARLWDEVRQAQFAMRQAQDQRDALAGSLAASRAEATSLRSQWGARLVKVAEIVAQMEGSPFGEVKTWVSPLRAALSDEEEETS